VLSSSAGGSGGTGTAISSLARAMLGLAAGAGEQPVVADAVKSLRQNVEQEAPDELAESTVRYLGIEVDDALSISEQVEL
jgi:hypothetical protein